MTETLSDVLRHSAEAVSAPSVDVAALVARAGKRQRRRRIMLALAATAVVGAVTAGSLAVRGGSDGDIEPAPSPSPAPPSSVAVDPTGARPMVYAAGSTLHVGDETFEASKPVAFIDATDDGAVYEAANDCTLWFTDGTTASVIGKSPWTAAPTARYGSGHRRLGFAGGLGRRHQLQAPGSPWVRRLRHVAARGGAPHPV